MFIPALKNLTALRNAPFDATISIVGVDYTGASLVRFALFYNPDDVTAALTLDIATVAPAEGWSMSVSTTGGVPTTVFTIRVNKSTIDTHLPWPANGLEPGATTALNYHFMATKAGVLGGAESRWQQGRVTYQPKSGPLSSEAPANATSLQLAADNITVLVVQGADLLAPFLATATTAAATATTKAAEAAASATAVAGVVLPNRPDSDLYSVQDPALRKAAAVDRAGVFRAALGAVQRLSGFIATFRRFALEDRYGAAVGSISATPFNAPQTEADAANRIARRVLTDGTNETTFASIFRASIRKLSVGELSVEDTYGRVGARFTRSPFADVPGTVDASGRSPEVRGADGIPRFVGHEGFQHFGGSLQVANATWTIEARRRVDGEGVHEIWRTGNVGGARMRLSPADSSDCLNPIIVATTTGEFVAYTKRVGRRVLRVGAPIGGGTEVALHSTNALVMIGDSYVTNTMEAGVRAALAVNRPINRLGSGGSRLIADRAVLLGGTVASTMTGLSNARSSDQGAKTTFVDNGNGTITYPGLPFLADRTLIVMQGGMEFDAPDVASFIQQLRDMLGWMRAVHKRMLIVEGVYGYNFTPAQFTAQAQAWAAVRADSMVGAYTMPTLAFMQANGTGGIVGSGGAASWQASNYDLAGGDNTHPSASGWTNIGACIAAEINARNW